MRMFFRNNLIIASIMEVSLVGMMPSRAINLIFQSVGDFGLSEMQHAIGMHYRYAATLLMLVLIFMPMYAKCAISVADNAFYRT